MADYRTEKDTLGEIKIPIDALYGAQTQRAIENFPISGLRFPRRFIQALGFVKAAAACVNAELGLLEIKLANAIEQAANDVAKGLHDREFPVDVFQTGSGTSTNMNANEVIANLAARRLGTKVHPNDHVNLGQSSNDVFPTAIHISNCLETTKSLLPTIQYLEKTIKAKADEVGAVIKTGRTHLMDAMPISIGQEMSGWITQLTKCHARIRTTLERMHQLAIGGTAVGTGINSHPEFGNRVATLLAERTYIPFEEAENHFEAQSTMDTTVELSGQLKTLAISLMKISNDLRWMNSGPSAGLAEINLPPLQPGSSIMPTKINPVISEATLMVCAEVIGIDTTLTIAGQSGNFQLNTMLPLIAYDLLRSQCLLANAMRLLADKAVAGLSINIESIASSLERNPIFVTALNPVVGYERSAEIAKKAEAEGRSIKEVALELSGLTEQQLAELLDPARLIHRGID